MIRRWLILILDRKKIQQSTSITNKRGNNFSFLKENDSLDLISRLNSNKNYNNNNDNKNKTPKIFTTILQRK